VNRPILGGGFDGGLDQNFAHGKAAQITASCVAMHNIATPLWPRFRRSRPGCCGPLLRLAPHAQKIAAP
jgi:hypothetical protein